jgi:hypothetical protein
MNILKKVFLAGLLVLAVGYGAVAQAKLGKIAILPFSGGTEDEREGIAERFANTPGIEDNFGIIPRTGITRAVANEQEFQALSGMTSADTIARLGNQFGAEYVMAGSITAVGTQKLLIITIVKIDVIRQVAGDFLTYESLGNLMQNRALIQETAENLVNMARSQDDTLDKLALLPVEFADGANEQEGDALAQLLAIHLLRHNAYAVYPRTKSLDQVQAEYKTQLGGATRDREAVVAGRADNPSFALSVASRKIGTMNRFNASIIDLEGGNQIAGQSEQYATLQDGINAIEFLARKFSGEEVSDRERNRRTSSVESTQASEKRAENWNQFLERSGIAFHFLFGSFGIVEKQDDDKNTPDKNEEVEEKRTSFYFPSVELRLSKYFAVQTGVNISRGFFEYIPASAQDPANYDTFTTIQLPVLARVNIPLFEAVVKASMEQDALVRGEPSSVTPKFFLSLFGGMALNLGTISDEAESLDPALLSFIAGVELGTGWRFSQWKGELEMSLGVLYNGDLGKSTATYKNADPLSYQRNNLGFYLNVCCYLPFR